MGGYALQFAVRSTAGVSVSDPAARAVGERTWLWFRTQLKRQRTKNKGFVNQVCDTLGIEGLDRFEVGGAPKKRVLSMVLTDAGGEGYVGMLASSHLLQRLVETGGARLNAALAPLRARLDLDQDEYVQSLVFVPWHGRIGHIEEVDGELIVEHDPVEIGDAYSTPVRKLPKTRRSRLERLWREQQCQCPGCVTITGGRHA
jgi:hypothetical protein